MKKAIITLFVLLLHFCAIAQGTPEITTLRMGSYKLFMPAAELEKLANKKLASATKEYSDEEKMTVTENGGNMEVTVNKRYLSETQPDVKQVTAISTKSAAFKTKSGMGVGSTRNELIEAYKDFNSFSVYPEWGEDGKPVKGTGYFSLNDMDAGTSLVFKLVNNKVVEVSLYIDEGGC